MTKKLEELLDLPESKDIINQENDKPKKPKKTHIPTETLEQLQEYDKIAAALPSVKGLGDIGDAELDEVSEKSMAAYDDLMDLGMNVEARFSGRIFEVAGQMLKVNLDSKVAKLDKKLKMVELQLKKEKLDKEANPEQNIIQGEGVLVTDRNSLLEKLKNMDK
jgi:hypothetical protein